MSAPEARKVADTLKCLSDARQDPQAITEGYMDQRIEPNEVVMTSVGMTHKAIITPAFPGLQLIWNFRERLMRAKAYQRPLAEACFRFSRERRVASVTIRGCLMPSSERVLETTWAYPLGDYSTLVESFDDVVNIIGLTCDTGHPINGRSGLVVASPERTKTHNWAISTHVKPAEAADALYGLVTERINYTTLSS